MANPTHDMNELKRRMQGAIQLLKQELGGLRTGRASASLLEPVQVEAYGTHMPLNQVATVSVPEPRLLSVQVWDRSMVHAVEKAIAASNLGLTPSNAGKLIRLPIPQLTEERRKELVKVVKHKAEEGRVAVRNLRRTARHELEALAKDGPDDRPGLAREISRAALMSARGNSGVILSQIVRGACDALAESDDLAQAFRVSGIPAVFAIRDGKIARKDVYSSSHAPRVLG